MEKRVLWSRDELLVAFRLYCRTPFGKLHNRNPDIIELAELIGRTPSAVEMKALNFASLDPVQQARDIAGLGNVSTNDRQLWEAFMQNPESIAMEAEEAYAKVVADQQQHQPKTDPELKLPDGPTEVVHLVRARLVQSFFRNAVMVSYDYSCALSGIAIPELLNASHIIPWSVDSSRRADPRNGIVFNALYDRAFDRGLISFDESLKVIVSDKLKSKDPPILQKQALLDIEGTELRKPHRFAPDPVAIAYHRENIFVA